MNEMRLLCLTALMVRSGVMTTAVPNSLNLWNVPERMSGGEVATAGPNSENLWNLAEINNVLSTGSSQQDKVPQSVDTVGMRNRDIQKYKNPLDNSKEEQEIRIKKKKGNSGLCEYHHGAWSSCNKLVKLRVRQDTLKNVVKSGSMKNVVKSGSMKAQKHGRLASMGLELNQNELSSDRSCPPSRTLTRPCQKRDKHKFGQCVYVSRHRIPWSFCQVSGIKTKKLSLVLQRPGVDCPPHKILAKVCQNKQSTFFLPNQIKAQIPLRPKCFMGLAAEEAHSDGEKKEDEDSVETSTNYLGQVVVELRLDTVPRTAENWRVLCEGTAGFGYAGTWFHRIVRGVMIQGGALGEAPVLGPSIYGPSFPDENFVLSHNSTGVLAMANSGTDSNGSQFFLTLRPTPWLDGRHVVLGQVVDGMEVLYKVSELGTNTGNVVSKVVIQTCRCQH